MNLELLYDILLRDNPSTYIKRNEDIIFKMIPELKVCVNFKQNNIWHVYDVYEHTLLVVDNVDKDINLRLAALFHDIGKCFVYNDDENGVRHFKNHWVYSNKIFLEFAKKYNIDDDVKDLVSRLILYHDMDIINISDNDMDELINNFNIYEIKLLFNLKYSDLLAKNSKFHYLLDEYKKIELVVLSKYN